MKYEYKIDRATYQLREKDLNEYGEQGWELCSVVEVCGDFYYYSKRIKN